MNTEKFDKLNNDVAGEMLKRDAIRQECFEKMRAIVHDHTQAMIAKEEAYELTEDEERMLKSYRAFRRREAVGSVFHWRHEEDKEMIILPAENEPCLIQDPREIRHDETY